MPAGEKRKDPPSGDSTASKKHKQTKGQWQIPRRGGSDQNASIEKGDAGIWATCDRGREGKCVVELKDLFKEYAEQLYGDQLDEANGGDDDEVEDADIEAEIKDEVDSLQKPAADALFRNVRIDVQCVIFLKTRKPVEPTSFVHTICKDAMETGRRRTRYALRLTPMTCMGKASEAGLEELAKKVLDPHFHSGDNTVKKYAIRTSIRNHGKTLTRDSIISQVATLVGPPHKVDLKNPDLVILVEVYKYHCGMSVVDGDFDKLKRYNIAEIYEPTEVVDAGKLEAASKVGEKGVEPTSGDDVQPPN